MDSDREITLILADDHGIVREGIAAVFRTRPELRILGQSSNGEEALDMIVSLTPDFAVLDLNMPRLSGLEVVKKARQLRVPTKLIVLSINRDELMIEELFRAGANGYVLKDGPARHLLDAISFIQDGGQYLTPLLRRESPESIAGRKDPVSQLSRREHEVFTFLVDGVRPRDIAKVLDISPKTVDTYRANIMRKLRVDGIAGLVRFAIQRNLTVNTPPDQGDVATGKS
jgi:DNA-binding NarL/FixJ family response regulator